MSDTHLLLPGAKTAVLVSSRAGSTHWVRKVAIGLGILAILIGAADLLARLSYKAFGACGAAVSFGPAISALDPKATQSAGGATPCK